MATVIEIKPLGNLANRMIQYLAAWKLQQELGDAEIRNPNLPEWGLAGRKIDDAHDASTLVIGRNDLMPFPALCLLARSEKFKQIVIDNYMQRMDCLPDRLTSASLFSATDRSYDPQDDELLINVRSAELVGGVRLYPLIPADFYDRTIKMSGLKPVFMGQIQENAYCRQLKTQFPCATFVPSQGPLRDFQTVRKARHIVIPVSTFSWLAAWLSEAKQIYMPVVGLFNPMSFGGRLVTDLLPTDDPRYRFFLFPLHFGLPEDQALRCHTSLTEHCREISPRQANFLRSQAPLLKSKTAFIDFDDVWYSHTHIHAAVEIAEGWFEGPLEHYLEIGMRRGYQAVPVGFSRLPSSIDGSLQDLSLHKRATQSSLSCYSVGATVEEDASRAISDGPLTPYAFHTDFEINPWWSVDLEDASWVKQVVVVNRSESEPLAGRACPLFLSTSLDNRRWSPRFQTPDGLIPGRDGSPLIWTAAEPVKARYVRLSVARSTCLHLRQVRILGSRSAANGSFADVSHAL